MPKPILHEYRIPVDVIDRVTPESLHLNSELREAKPESPPAGGSAREPELVETRDGLFHQFEIAEARYRVGGVRPLFVTSLRVSVRASYGGKSYYDSFDLYSAKARGAFSEAMARATGSELGRVERDLVMILERLEKDRDRAMRSFSERKKDVEVSEEDRELGMEFLRDRRIMERITEDMSVLGYVGEEVNKELVYLCASSRKLEDPISVIIVSQSAAGKSYLVETVRKLMPVEDVVAVTSLSDQALNYVEDLSHKFLILGEAVHGEVVEHQIREMLSGKELSRLVTEKDAETGKMRSRVVRTPVIVASVMSGTNRALNPENASRCFLVNADESREQTRRIHEAQRNRYTLESVVEGKARVGMIVRRHQAAQRILTNRKIVNEFAPLLDFPTDLMRSRRDHDRFLDLIACVCFLRQYQKDEVDTKGVRYLRCDLEDYRVAYRIMVEGVLTQTIRELPSGVIGFYDELRAWARLEARKERLGTEEVSFTQRQVREVLKLGHTWVKNALRELVDYDYLVIQKGGRERSKAYYRLREDVGVREVDLSMIPSVEEMEKKLTRGNLGELVESGQ